MVVLHGAIPGLATGQPAGRRAFEQVKQREADAHANAPDFDDYTRAKARFFDHVHDQHEQVASQRGRPGHA